MTSAVVEIEKVIQRVLDTDPSSCDLPMVRARLDDSRRIDAFLAARVAAYTAVHERLLADAATHPRVDPPDDAVPVPQQELPPLPPQSARDARRLELRAKWLLRCPLFADALGEARVTPQVVDVLASVLQPLEPTVVAHVLAEEERLVRLASKGTPDTFRGCLHQLIDEARGDFGQQRLERQRANSKASTWIDDEGMYRLSIALDPERGPVMFDAIAKRIGQLRNQPTNDTRTEAELRLQAVLDLIAGTAPVTTEVLVVVDERTLRSGPHPHSICETEAGVALPPSVAVDLCAHAKVTAAIVDANGNVGALGSSPARTATREQRRALRAMHRTCAHPDCPTPFTDCVIHHVQHWEHGGKTAVGNLLPLCYEHHHLVHEGGWNVTIDEQRTLRWYRPDGTLERTTLLQPLLERVVLRHVDQREAVAAGTAELASGRAPPRLFDPHAA